MRTIISVKPNQGSTRGLVHYIAHSKTDQAREKSDGRELFNQNLDRMTVAEANKKLKFVPSGTRPKSDELLHLVVSFSSDVYAQAGNTENERLESVKTVVKAMMEKLREKVHAKDLQWAGAVHLNTDNPHVHLAVQKQYLDAQNKLQVLTKIPAKLLPHYETNQNEKTLKIGTLVETADKQLENAIAQADQSRGAKTAASIKQPHFHQTRSNLTEVEISNAKASKVEWEREILAQAILAKYRLDKSIENLESLENHGDKRRFKVFDQVTGKTRKLSLFDLERRANAVVSRKLSKHNIADPAEKDRLRQQLFNAEIEKNVETITRIKAVLVNLIVREQKQHEKCEKDFLRIKPAGEQIRREYRQANKKLPAPALTENELEMLQRRSAEKRDVRTLKYLEAVRKELARERERPTRGNQEIERFKAVLTMTELSVLANEKKLRVFDEQNRHFQFSIDGKKWSLAKADALLADEEKNRRKFAGKVNALLVKVGLQEIRGKKANIEKIKEQISHALAQNKDTLEKELRGDKLIFKTLKEIYDADTNPDKDELQPKFNAHELAEIESLALELDLIESYRENWQAQKDFVNQVIARGQNSAENEKSAPRVLGDETERENFVARRSIAREVLSEIKLAEAREKLEVFNDKKQFQKFDIVNPKTGEIKQVCAHDVKFDARGSILDQTLEYLTEAREKSDTRKTIAKLLAARENELKTAVKIAEEIHQFARAQSKDYKQTSLFKNAAYTHEPLFTPKELVRLELRGKQTESKTEAVRLAKFLDSADSEHAQNLSTMLAAFTVQNPKQPVVKENEVLRIETDREANHSQTEKAGQQNTSLPQLSNNNSDARQPAARNFENQPNDKQIKHNRDDKTKGFIR